MSLVNQQVFTKQLPRWIIIKNIYNVLEKERLW
jgi:hypothetical protein